MYNEESGHRIIFKKIGWFSFNLIPNYVVVQLKDQRQMWEAGNNRSACVQDTIHLVLVITLRGSYHSTLHFKPSMYLARFL